MSEDFKEIERRWDENQKQFNDANNALKDVLLERAKIVADNKKLRGFPKKQTNEEINRDLKVVFEHINKKSLLKILIKEYVDNLFKG